MQPSELQTLCEDDWAHSIYHSEAVAWTLISEQAQNKYSSFVRRERVSMKQKRLVALISPSAKDRAAFWLGSWRDHILRGALSYMCSLTRSRSPKRIPIIGYQHKVEVRTLSHSGHWLTGGWWPFKLTVMLFWSHWRRPLKARFKLIRK